MPEDTLPISTTVPETVTVDTGASPEDTKTLKDSFKDFWAEEEAKAEAPPAPEATGPAQETKEDKELQPAEEPVVKTEERKAVPTETTQDYSDDEIDRMELHAGQSAEVYQQFKEVKDLWKADRTKLREELERTKRFGIELAEARANQMTPEIKADYEHAAGIRRRFDYASDPEFINRFHQPVINQYHSALDEAASMLSDPNEGARWAAFVKENFKDPDSLSREWWTNSVIARVPNELDRDQLRSTINDLLKAQKERRSELFTRTNDQASFEGYIQERVTTTQQRVQEQIMAEIGKQEQRIKEVLPVDVSQAKTKEERAAMEAHNERFKELNEHFVSTMKDLSANGPSAWVRAAVEATRTKIMNQQIINLEKENKEVRTERDRLKGELEKISGARRKIAQTSGTPPTPTGKPSQNGQGLSIKDLDIRKSFQKFDWGDNS